MSGAPLVCPRCATMHPSDERLCPACGLPLVPLEDDDPPVSPARERARKVKPSYTAGELVRVVTARNQVEAEFIQSLLLEEGIPSTLRRTRGFDVPEMLAAGPRDILVPLAGLEAAREMLLQADLLPTEDASISPERLAVGLLLALVVVGAIVWVGSEFLA